MRPRRAALLTPPSPTPAFLQNVVNSCICHTSENSPVTPIIATDPKTRSRKSCVCHTCDPLPPTPFHLPSPLPSLATSHSHFQVPSLVGANLPLYFQAVAGCSPRNPFLFMFLHVAGGWVGASPEGLLPSAQCSLSRIPAPSLHLRSPHPAKPRAGILAFRISHHSRITRHFRGPARILPFVWSCQL